MCTRKGRANLLLLCTQIERLLASESISELWVVGKVCECVLYWLTLVADLYETMFVGGPLWTQFDDVVFLVVVFFALLSRSIGFQIIGNLMDIMLVFF